VAHGEQSRASPRRHTHLPVRVLNMGVCSLGRDPERPGDLLGLQPLGEEADDGAFSRGQPGRPAQLGALCPAASTTAATAWASRRPARASATTVSTAWSGGTHPDLPWTQS
jgi:hypothetical protein